MSLVTDEGNRSVAKTFDLLLIDLASVLGEVNIYYLGLYHIICFLS